MYSYCFGGDMTTNNSWPLVNGELLFSVVYVLDPTVEDSDALLTNIYLYSHTAKYNGTEKNNNIIIT
jgi:hypothetical protein